ncbi:hypothetical protein QBZ16_004288 [Prototheca wickerhamii]|uniref:Protein kinase domain-containing protein n=1 Tax=Prototheca wickerhamii TaxID=3111 RepID=A0AAD9IH25_PROWI|nr:hypothetical protein QBZ16_004288 [Prototheca wickerhamii]
MVVGIVPGQINLTTQYAAAINLTIGYGSTDMNVLQTALKSALASLLDAPASSVNATATALSVTSASPPTAPRTRRLQAAPAAAPSAGGNLALAETQTVFATRAAAAAAVAALGDGTARLRSLLAAQLVGAPGFVPAQLVVIPRGAGAAVSPQTAANASLTQSDLRAGAYGALRAAATAPAIRAGVVAQGMPADTQVLIDQPITFTANANAPPLASPPPPSLGKKAGVPFWAWIVLGVGLALLALALGGWLWLRRRRAAQAVPLEGTKALPEVVEAPLALPGQWPTTTTTSDDKFDWTTNGSPPVSPSVFSAVDTVNTVNTTGTIVPAASSASPHAEPSASTFSGGVPGLSSAGSPTRSAGPIIAPAPERPASAVSSLGLLAIPRSAVELSTPRELDLAEESEDELGSAAAPAVEAPLAGVPVVQLMAPRWLRTLPPSTSDALATRQLADRTEHLSRGATFGPGGRWRVVDGSATGAACLVRYALDAATQQTVAVKFYADEDEHARQVALHERNELDALCVNPLIAHRPRGAPSDADGALPPYTVSPAPDFTLRELLESGRSVQPPQSTVLFADAAAALASLHAAGLCHGALSPAALGFFGRQGRWKLIAAEGWAREGEPAPLYAELRYAAPEQCRADLAAAGAARPRVAADPAVDAWALGAIAFEVIAGRALFPPGAFSDEDVVRALMGYKELPTEGAGALATAVEDPHARRALAHLVRRRPDRRWSAQRAAHCNLVRAAGDLSSVRVLTRAGEASMT